MLSEERTIRRPTVDWKVGVKIVSQREDIGEQPLCEFCGAKLPVQGVGCKDRRKYCSKSCQSGASRGRILARMATPPTKRYSTTLKFSDPLYFN